MGSKMPLPLLDNDCIGKILSFLDNETLYKCLFVNKYCCKLSIPTIWRDPFASKFSKNSSLLSLTNTLLACLNEDEISSLIPCSINLNFNNQTPLFEYGKFIRKIDHYGIIHHIRAWLIHTDCDHDCRIQKLINAIYNMIMRKSSNIQELIMTLEGSHVDFDLPKSFILPIYKPGITNLRSLDIEICSEFKIEELQNMIDFLSMVPKFCNGIVNYSLWIHELSNSVFIKKLLDIIRLQPLERITMYFHRVCKEIVKKFLYTSEFRSDTLKGLKFVSLDCKDIDLSFISNLEYLEYLEFKNCYDFTYHEALTKKKLHIKELNLWSHMGIDMIKFLCSESLLKLSLKFVTPDEVKVVKDSCPNIIYLHIELHSENDLDSIPIIGEISTLKILSIRNNIDEDSLSSVLIDHLKSVEYLLFDFHIKLSTFTFLTKDKANFKIDLAHRFTKYEDEFFRSNE